jgi:Leucine-rich repeat (LRR) protein
MVYVWCLKWLMRLLLRSHRSASQLIVFFVTRACRTSLNFTYLTYTGRLPESLGKLHMLSSLNVFHNDLNGNIPASLGNLASLTSLSLGSNRLRGA